MNSEISDKLKKILVIDKIAAFREKSFYVAKNIIIKNHTPSIIN